MQIIKDKIVNTDLNLEKLENKKHPYLSTQRIMVKVVF